MKNQIRHKISIHGTYNSLEPLSVSILFLLTLQSMTLQSLKPHAVKSNIGKEEHAINLIGFSSFPVYYQFND